MAIIRGAFGGAQIRNSLSSVTFAQGPFGTVARARTPPVNPNSARQVAIRAALALVSFRWSNLLTSAQRQAWDAYAATTPLPDPFGGTKLVSGRQMWMRTNVIFADLLGTVLDAAPGTPGVGQPPLLTIAASTANGLEVTAITPTIAAGALVNVRVGLPVNFARNFYKAPFTNVATIDSTTVFPITLIPAAQMVIGQRYFTASRHIEVDGKVSERTIFQADVTA